MIEIAALAGTVVGYLVKSLKENKDFNKFTTDFTSAVTNDLIRPVFLIDEDKPNKILQDLEKNPDEELNQESVKIEILKHIKQNPDVLDTLKLMVQEIKQKGSGVDATYQIHQKHSGSGDNNVSIKR